MAAVLFCNIGQLVSKGRLYSFRHGEAIEIEHAAVKRVVIVPAMYALHFLVLFVYEVLVALPMLFCSQFL